ncbi:MAG: APC family permease [Firmicutes bacterium]|nr:APC family permease [Bacillota bacterium]
MFRQIMRWLLGKRLATHQLAEERFSVLWGLPILASDAVSSVAYAVEEILIILVPAIGVLSFLWLPWVAGAIIVLLLILTLSYRQTVEAYPGGGGAYIVAKENLKPIYGLIVGASLLVDYTLTVAVSITAGTAAITSALPSLFPYHVGIAVTIIILMVLGNLRGLRESSRIFSIPTYAFIFTTIALIVVGIYKHSAGLAPVPAEPMVEIGTSLQAVLLVVLLRAFSSGCAAVTGVEAISDAVPSFREPAVRNAKSTYVLLAAAIIITFGGIAYLAKLYQVVPVEGQTVMAQLAHQVFGQGFMFYLVQATTAVILGMAANTAFAGFPTLLSIIAQDGYVPRQFAMRGHRLSFSNGIVFLAVMAALLVIIFEGDTHLLIPLYALGVFTSFTLAQIGLLVRWFRLKVPGWHYKAFINGLGAVITLTTVIIVTVTKFSHGAWIVLVVVPILVLLMLRIRLHYSSVAKQLDVPNEALPKVNLKYQFEHHIIVPLDSINAMVLKALRYARGISKNVVAFHVEIKEGGADKLKRKWEQLDTDIPLVVKFSQYREIVETLTEYIRSEEHSSRPGDMITVLLPQFFVSHWWQAALHNNTSLFIANAMFHKRNVVVSVVPFYLEDLLTRRELENLNIRELLTKLGVTAAELAFEMRIEKERILEVIHLKLKDVPDPLRTKIIAYLLQVKENLG